MRPKCLLDPVRVNLNAEKKAYLKLQSLLSAGKLAPLKTMSEWLRREIDDELLKWR